MVFSSFANGAPGSTEQSRQASRRSNRVAKLVEPIRTLSSLTASSLPARLAAARPSARLRFQRPRVDRFDLFLLAILAALSLWTLGLDVWHAAAHGLIWTGSDSIYAEDGMQSMSWIQGILHHGASPDMYVLGHTPADFFQPLLGISAGVTALGVAPYVALLLWKPVAVVGIFFAARTYVHRTVSGQWPRRAALALALFFAWGAVIGDSWIPWWSWGYPFALLSLACALGALLAYARDRAAQRIGLLPPLLGALASWLHPWQGEILILILLVSELSMFLLGERVGLLPLVLTVALTALPLGYFALLVHFDSVWQQERQVALSTFPLSDVARAFAPLALPALLAYRRRPPSFIALTARVWPLAALAIFGFSEWQGSGSTHALLGITIPLAVVSVEGVCSLPWKVALRHVPSLPLLALPLVAVLTIPGTIHMLNVARAATRPKRGNSNFITSGENAALTYLAHDPRPGGVLTRFYLGMVVPPKTGRQTYVGNCYWSEPNCSYRGTISEKLLIGQLQPADARRFVERSGARFVLADCRSRDLTATLAPITIEVHRFSCATVYVVR